MKKEKFNCMEVAVLYCVERSVGKSIPITLHKVPKPENLKTMIEMLKKDK